MIGRSITFGIALAGGLVTAQLPEFSQQYLQRLGGVVDALSEVVSDFDASAAASGLSRGEALAQMTGSAFLDRRQDDMARTFERYERLQAQLTSLQDAPAGSRAFAVLRAPDQEVAAAAFDVFRPALPVTADGLMFGGGGFLVSAFAAGGAGRLLRRRRRPA